MCFLALLTVLIAWLLGVRPRKRDQQKLYHFRGEFCGVELWEYSAAGNEIAIWADWHTNYNGVHLVMRTNTVENYVREKL